MRLYTDPQRGRQSSDVVLTPMIDVIFLLQIFFLCTAGFARPEATLPVQAPLAKKEQPAAAEPDIELVQITLRGAGDAIQIELNGQPVATIEQLLERMRVLGQAAADLPVIFDIGPDVAVGSLVRVYDGCLAAGLGNINFAIPSPPGK